MKTRTNSSPNKVSISARIPFRLECQLKELAAAEQVTVTAVVEKLLNDGINRDREHRSAPILENAQTLSQLKLQVQTMASGMQQLALGMDQLRAQMKAQAEAPVRLPPIIGQMVEGMREHAKGYFDIVNAVNGFGPVFSEAMVKNNRNLVEQLRDWLRGELGKVFPISKAQAATKEIR